MGKSNNIVKEFKESSNKNVQWIPLAQDRFQGEQLSAQLWTLSFHNDRPFN